MEKQELIRSGVSATKVITITNGIEDEAFVDVEKKASDKIRSLVKSYGSYMIQIGRIYDIKNFETVLKAMPKLPQSLNFVIVGPIGDTAYKVFLDDLIKKLDLSDRVFFLGVIRGVDKYYLIKHAELMVHMARWESFCNAVHEGMSQGRVCIVSDSFALPYLVKHGVNGYCLPYHDDSLLVSYVYRVLTNKEERHNIELNNIRITREHSWRAVAMQIMRLLDPLIVG